MEKIKEFEKNVEKWKNLEIFGMQEHFAKSVEIVKNLEFVSFDNKNHFFGDTKNLIFLTYNDHASGNSATWQSICQIHQPHQDFDDRGYLRGIALDLFNYMALRSIFFVKNQKKEDFLNQIFCQIPFFKGKNKQKNEAICAEILDKARHECFLEYKKRFGNLNAILKETTGISALQYITQI